LTTNGGGGTARLRFLTTGASEGSREKGKRKGRERRTQCLIAREIRIGGTFIVVVAPRAPVRSS
jgi:hypothetical protein